VLLFHDNALSLYILSFRRYTDVCQAVSCCVPLACNTRNKAEDSSCRQQNSDSKACNVDVVNVIIDEGTVVHNQNDGCYDSMYPLSSFSYIYVTKRDTESATPRFLSKNTLVKTLYTPQLSLTY
jgi:hypothetical protein